MDFDAGFAFEALKAALKATPTTLLLAAVPFVVGLVLGTVLAAARTYKIRAVARLAQAFVVVVRGIPIVLILLISNFAITAYFDSFAAYLHIGLRAKNIDPIIIALIALSIIATASISEAMRGAIHSIGDGQFEAGYSIGLTRVQTLCRIILPQALPVAIPVLCSIFIGLVKGSSLAFMIAVTDLLNASLNAANENYRYLEAYVAAAVLYWILNIAIERISHILEKNLTKHLRRGVV